MEQAGTVPFSGNPSFPLPEPSTLWRYVSIDKFLAMLVDDALFFSRLDYLGGPSAKGRVRHKSQYDGRRVGDGAPSSPSTSLR